MFKKIIGVFFLISAMGFAALNIKGEKEAEGYSVESSKDSVFLIDEKAKQW